MVTYPQRVRENILPLSIGSTLPEAFEEWSFHDETIDNETSTETCELCNQEDLRYQFKIENSLAKKYLWIGSSCILKFDLSVFEEGQKLGPEDAKKKLNRLVRQMQLEECIRALDKLAKAENNEILSNALIFYKKNKYLTPKQALVVFWKLHQHKISYHPSFFK